MAEEDYIPIWDGRADSLRDCWIELHRLEEDSGLQCLAVRFAMRQKGSAKLRALEFEPKDLEYRPARMELDVETGQRWNSDVLNKRGQSESIPDFAVPDGDRRDES